MSVCRDLGNGVGAQRVVVGNLAVGGEEGDHDVARDPGCGGGLHGADGGGAVDGVGTLRASLAAGPGGPDDRVSTGEDPGELSDVGFLDGQDQRGGSGGGDVGGVVGVADEGDDLVAGVHQQRGGQQRDLAVAPDHDNAGHARVLSVRPGCSGPIRRFGPGGYPSIHLARTARTPSRAGRTGTQRRGAPVDRCPSRPRGARALHEGRRPSEEGCA